VVRGSTETGFSQEQRAGGKQSKGRKLSVVRRLEGGKSLVAGPGRPMLLERSPTSSPAVL